jgi:hypothetical protein
MPYLVAKGRYPYVKIATVEGVLSVVALITKLEEIELVIPWARSFAEARDTGLHVLCCSFGLARGMTLEEGAVTEQIGDEADRFGLALTRNGITPETPVQWLRSADVVTPAVDYVMRNQVDLLVAAAQDPAAETGAAYATNPLLRRSPCNTVILFGTTAPQQSRNRVLVVTQDNNHDRAAVSLAGRLAKIADGRAIVAVIEEESGEEAIEVGNREILQLVRDAGVD